MNRCLHGDCLDILPVLDAESFDACVTDPPYHLTQLSRGGHARTNNPESPHGRHRIGDKGFMGKQWDGGDVAHDPETWRAVLRVLKPGAHLLAFGGTRTYHRLVCAIEDAGFEIRDQVQWIFGSGFPKSLNVANEIAEAGAAGLFADRSAIESAQWNGWGTALKPAHEPIVLARKPLIGTVAENLLLHGTGAVNVDGCRIPTNGEQLSVSGRGAVPCRHDEYSSRAAGVVSQPHDLGRWPANVIHDGSDEVVAMFPAEAGAFAPVKGTEPSNGTKSVFGQINRHASNAFHGDRGSAARFFYCPKADRTDRNEGLDGFIRKPLNFSSGEQSPGTFQSPNTDRSSENHHPTVKPTALMRYLCRLITPPGGVIIDPFGGSGSTGKAAALEGFGFVIIEREAEYCAIADARTRHVAAALT